MVLHVQVYSAQIFVDRLFFVGTSFIYFVSRMCSSSSVETHNEAYSDDTSQRPRNGFLCQSWVTTKKNYRPLVVVLQQR